MFPFFKISSRVSPYFRRRRLARFLEVFPLTKSIRILDVGGLPTFWSSPVPAQITLLNLGEPPEFLRRQMTPNMSWIVGDGTKLPFNDREFDLVVSNSVIEHVGTWERQQAFAREILRVGRSHWIQTPAFECPIEPHYYGLYVHRFPKPVQKRLLRNLTLWGLVNRPSEAVIDSALAELRILRRSEFEHLFPDSTIWVERLAGLPKSYTAYRTFEAKKCRLSVPPSPLLVEHTA